MIRLILLGITAALVLMNPASAGAGEVGVQIEFSDLEISAIRAFYRDQGSHKHGKKKNGKGRKSLPPGIAKNLRRGKPLPPGIAKQVLPDGLIRLLPPAPRGYERIMVAGKVLLVEIATQVIHDVLEDVILG